jgi:aquaporin Z
MLWRREVFAEALGTYGLVFAGCGAICVEQLTGALGHVGVAIVWGLIVLAMIEAFGEVSGAHFNPAVTLAFAIAGRFPKNKIIPFIIGQSMGGLLAACSLLLFFPLSPTLGSSLPHPEFGSTQISLGLEVLLTFALMLVILQVSTGAKEKGITAGLTIGGVVLLEAMFAGPICGASMNPVRSLAPALVSGNLQSLWAYIIGPITGAALAVPVWKVLYGRS